MIIFLLGDNIIIICIYILNLNNIVYNNCKPEVRKEVFNFKNADCIESIKEETEKTKNSGIVSTLPNHLNTTLKNYLRHSIRFYINPLKKLELEENVLRKRV